MLDSGDLDGKHSRSHVDFVIAQGCDVLLLTDIRRWFLRSRTALGGASPIEVLTGDWNPDDDAARDVRVLAAALLGSPAT